MDNHATATHSAEANAKLLLAPHLDQMEDSLTLLNERALDFIRERPVVALLGAVALGFIVGKIASRS